MKLNIGCGGTYKKGFINLDRYDTTVADTCMSASQLQFPDNSVDIIEADQIIEHLGIPEGIYALSEWYRVLKAGGTMKIETPDIDTALKTYVQGDANDKKNIFPWIFGLHTQGYRHKCLFPKQFLVENLKKIGFKDIHVKTIKDARYHPVLKVSCGKSFDPTCQFVSLFRSRLLKKEIIDMNDHVVFSAQEQFIDSIQSTIKTYHEKKKKEYFDKLLIECCIFNPLFAEIFLDVSLHNNVIKEDDFNRRREVIKLLEEINYPLILMHLFKETPGYAGGQENLYSFVKKIGEKNLWRLFEGENKRIEKTLRKLAASLKMRQNPFYFSELVLRRHSTVLYNQGIKEYHLGNYKESLQKFKESIALFRNNLFNYWNLARLYNLEGKTTVARDYYTISLDLLEQVEDSTKEKVTTFLKKELKEINVKKIDYPSNYHQF